MLRGHTDYINSIVYEPEKGDLVLSGSDDHTAKMWEESECVATVNFSSPVMSVAWHQQDLGKVGLSMACSIFYIESQGADWAKVGSGLPAQLLFLGANPLR